MEGDIMFERICWEHDYDHDDSVGNNNFLRLLHKSFYIP